MFLTDPLDVPAEVVTYPAEQLDIADPTCVKSYTERKQTRYDHQDEIVRADGLTDFAQVERELVAWIADQAWMTGDGPKALTAGAVRWFRTLPHTVPRVRAAKPASTRSVSSRSHSGLVAGRAGVHHPSASGASPVCAPRSPGA
ncbi:DUF4158 domain-containing protein [Nocardia sp. NPDC049707]|uniref:DUF4158 domain-containing protein n=1 Tax=Nocardia sp. NPDC049707 TaxID=3154735 RepID=UPI00342AF28F